MGMVLVAWCRMCVGVIQRGPNPWLDLHLGCYVCWVLLPQLLSNASYAREGAGAGAGSGTAEIGEALNAQLPIPGECFVEIMTIPEAAMGAVA